MGAECGPVTAAHIHILLWWRTRPLGAAPIGRLSGINTALAHGERWLAAADVRQFKLGSRRRAVNSGCGSRSWTAAGAQHQCRVSLQCFQAPVTAMISEPRSSCGTARKRSSSPCFIKLCYKILNRVRRSGESGPSPEPNSVPGLFIPCFLWEERSHQTFSPALFRSSLSWMLIFVRFWFRLYIVFFSLVFL